MGAWLQVCCRPEHLQLLLLFHAVGLSSNLVVFVVYVSVFLLFCCCVWYFYVVACVALLVESYTMTYVISATLVIGFGFCCVIDLVSFQTKLEVFQDYDFQ